MHFYYNSYLTYFKDLSHIEGVAATKGCNSWVDKKEFGSIFAFGLPSNIIFHQNINITIKNPYVYMYHQCLDYNYIHIYIYIYVACKYIYIYI